jgi:hypothetical protein
MRFSLDYSHKPLEYDLHTLGAGFAFVDTRSIQIQQNSSRFSDQIGYILCEVLGRNIHLTNSDGHNLNFDKLNNVNINLRGVPFQKKLSFYSEDVSKALASLLQTQSINNDVVSLDSSLQNFAKYLEDNKIPFVINFDSHPVQFIVDAPYSIVSDPNFRKLFNSSHQPKDSIEVSIDPTNNTQVCEINRIASGYGFDSDSVSINHDTKSIHLKISTDDLMDATTRQARDQFYSSVRLLTGYSNEPLYDIGSQRCSSGKYLIPGENLSEIHTKNVPFACLPLNIWRAISPSSNSFIAVGQTLNDDNLAEFLQFLGSSIGVNLKINNQSKDTNLVVDFDPSNSSEKIIKFVQLVNDAINFYDLPTKPSYNLPNNFWHDFLGNLPELASSFWISNRKNQIVIYSAFGEISEQIQDAFGQNLPGIEYQYGKTPDIINQSSQQICQELILPYVDDIEARLNLIIGLGEVSVGNNGVLIHLPAFLEEHNDFLETFYSNFKNYPFQIGVVFDSDSQIKNWDRASLFGLFDSLNPRHVPVSFELGNDSINVTLYHHGRAGKYSESFVKALSSITGKRIQITYQSHSIFEQNIGIDPSIVRKIFGQTDKKGVLPEDKYVENYGTRLNRPKFSVVNQDFVPCGKLFTYDTGTQRFDTAIAVNRISDNQIQLQIFAADIASFALPGSFVENLILSRIESRYHIRNEILWNNLLPQTIVDQVTLKAGTTRRCFVYDVTLRSDAVNPIEFNGITYADVCVDSNFDVNGSSVGRLEDDFSLYQDCCNILSDYRKSLGGVLRNCDVELLAEPTLLVNYLTGVYAQEAGVPLIYHQVSNLFTQLGRNGLLRYLEDFRTKSPELNEIWDKFYTNNTSATDFGVLISKFEVLMQDLLDVSEFDMVTEIQKRFVGKANHSVAPTYNHIGTGYEVSARIVPGIRSVTAVINQGQLLAHYLGGDVRSAAQLSRIIELLDDRRVKVDNLIKRLD